MNHNQIAKNNMFKKLLTFFAAPANAAIWAAFARLVTEISNFVTLNGTLDDATQTQAQVTTGITQGKTDAFNDMIKKAVEMAFKAFVWAVDNNNDELTHVFDVQLSDFDNIAEQTAYDKVKNIRDGISDNIAGMAPVELLPADVTALDALIAAYELVRQAPEVAIGHKETSTDDIVDLFHQIDSSLGLISRLIISQYSTTNAGMVSDFKNNKHIDDLPTQHSGIHLHITDATTGLDIPGAILSIPEAGKTTTSDFHGIAEIIKVKPKEYQANVTCPGYHSYPFLTKILRGKINSINVQLASASSANSAILEGNITPSGTEHLNLNDMGIDAPTIMTIEISDTLRGFGSATDQDTPAPGATFWDMPAPVSIKTAAQLVLLTGLSESKPMLNLQNLTGATVHYKITFQNLAG